MRAVVLALLVAACTSGPGARPDAGPADAAPDGPCEIDPAFEPLVVSGSSPVGPLDVFHYAFTGHVDGFCPEAYLFTITRTQADLVCTHDNYLLLGVLAPFQSSGTHAAFATITGPHDTYTDAVTFEATLLDPPTDPSPRIRGRFVSQDPAWSFDIAVDATSKSSTTCI